MFASLIDFIVILPSQYKSLRNCLRHCSLPHQKGMIEIGVIWGRRQELRATAAMCSQGTALVLSAPQVHVRIFPQNLVQDHWYLGNGGSNQWDDHVCPEWRTRTMLVGVWLGVAG